MRRVQSRSNPAIRVSIPINSQFTFRFPPHPTIMADREFVDSREDVAYTNNSAQEDQRNAESERTGTVPRCELLPSQESFTCGSLYPQPRSKISRTASAVVRPSTNTPARQTRSSTPGRSTTCSTRQSRGRSETGRLVVCTRNATSHVHVTIYYRADQSSCKSTTFPFARATLAASERPRGDGGRDASGVAAGSGCSHSGRTVMRRRCSWHQPRR